MIHIMVFFECALVTKLILNYYCLCDAKKTRLYLCKDTNITYKHTNTNKPYTSGIECVCLLDYALLPLQGSIFLQLVSIWYRWRYVQYDTSKVAEDFKLCSLRENSRQRKLLLSFSVNIRFVSISSTFSFLRVRSFYDLVLIW